jgi:hypothetical protein
MNRYYGTLYKADYDFNGLESVVTIFNHFSGIFIYY